MKKPVFIAALLASALLAPGLASASTIAIKQTLDASRALFSNFLDTENGLSKSVLIGMGDTVDLSYSFQAGQALQVSGDGNQSFWAGLIQDDALSPANTSRYVTTNVSVELLDAKGHKVAAIHENRQLGGDAGLGAQLIKFFKPGESLTFSSIHTRFYVDGLASSPSYYKLSDLTIYADNLKLVKTGAGIVAALPVPEPHTYAMLVAGLGLLGAAAYRRKSR